jgi:Kef-type K+ transport system membrane component KefB
MAQVSTENLIVVAVTMAIAAGIPALLPRLPLPGVVLEIVLGVIVGPQVLGLVHPQVTLNFLADFGLGMYSRAGRSATRWPAGRLPL